MSMIACDSYQEHAWKKEFCANCRKAKSMHTNTGPVPTRRAAAPATQRQQTSPRLTEVSDKIIKSVATSQVAQSNGHRKGSGSDSGELSRSRVSTFGKPDVAKCCEKAELKCACDCEFADEGEEEEEEIYGSAPLTKSACSTSTTITPSKKSTAPDVVPSSHYYHKYDVSTRGTLGRSKPANPRVSTPSVAFGEVANKLVPVDVRRIQLEAQSDLALPYKVVDIARKDVNQPYTVVDVSTTQDGRKGGAGGPGTGMAVSTSRFSATNMSESARAKSMNRAMVMHDDKPSLSRKGSNDSTITDNYEPVEADPNLGLVEDPEFKRQSIARSSGKSAAIEARMAAIAHINFSPKKQESSGSTDDGTSTETSASSTGPPPDQSPQSKKKKVPTATLR